MGYRFGERKYGEGLYSRWPDWWRAKTCVQQSWTVQPCVPPLWAVSDSQRKAWTPIDPTLAREILAVGVRRG